MPQPPNRITEIHTGKHRALTFNILVLGQNTTQGLGYEVNKGLTPAHPTGSKPRDGHSLWHTQATEASLPSGSSSTAQVNPHPRREKSF